VDTPERHSGQIQTGFLRNGTGWISAFAATETRALAAIGDEEEEEDGGDGNGKAGPVERPARSVCAGAKAQPIACPKVSSKVAEAAGQERQERLRASAPDGIDAFVEIDLRSDKDEGEGKAVQSDACEQPRFLV